MKESTFSAIFYSTKDVVIIPKMMLRFLTPEQALFLSYGIYLRRESKSKDGFFLCTTKMVEEELLFTQGTQNRVLKELTYNGLIQRKQMGMPSRRWIWINKKKLVELYLKTQVSRNRKGKGQNHSSKNFGIYKYIPQQKKPVPEENNSNSTINSSNNEFIQIKPETTKKGYIPTKEEIELAATLFKSLKYHNKITQNVSMRSWAKTISQIINLDKIPIKELSQVLLWYTRNIGNQFIPIVWSAKSFRAKYPRIREKYNAKKDVELSEEFLPSARMLQSNYPWAKGTKGEVPNCVQISGENYRKFFRNWKLVFDQIHKRNMPGTTKAERGHLKDFMLEVFKQMPSAVVFAEKWMKQVSNRISRWDSFSGDLRSLAFNGSIENKHFKTFIFTALGENHGFPAENLWSILKPLWFRVVENGGEK